MQLTKSESNQVNPDRGLTISNRKVNDAKFLIKLTLIILSVKAGKYIHLKNKVTI